MSRGPAIVATIMALALINLGLAGIIVQGVGARSFTPLWVTLVLLLCGVVATVGATTLWRGYLRSRRDPSPPDH